MDASNTGGDNDLVSALNASPRQRPDISAGFARLRALLQAWSQLTDEDHAKLSSFGIDSPAQLIGIPYPMPTDVELQNRARARSLLGTYVDLGPDVLWQFRERHGYVFSGDGGVT